MTGRTRLVLVAASIAVAAASGGAGWLWHALARPFRGWEGEALRVEVAAGSSARRIFEQLEAAGVIADATLARAWYVMRLDEPPLKAGEYVFDEARTLPRVLDTLVRGEVATHEVTVPEGLTLEETAAVLAAGGFGDADELLAEMRSPRAIADLDPRADDLEGYLYPETYSFARGTPASAIVETMVDTFRRQLSQRVLPLAAPDERGAVRELVTLASIVEKEAGLSEERPLVAGVFANRLRRGIALYADPTIIFALKRLGRWDGNLRKADLELDSPYNTYRYGGLPPGPICSPGLASLRAAAWPADVPYLYFVSRNDGSHVFAATLGEHNRNVERWQRRYWRERGAH